MPPPPMVSVILVAWNSKAVLPVCLNKLSVQSFRDFEVILVDNGSKDDAVRNLDKKHPGLDIHVQRMDRNHGFAAGNNIGAQLARGKWLVLLNADAFPEPDWLEMLVAAAESHPQVASFSSRQIQEQDPRFLDGAGDAYHVSGLAWRIALGYPAALFGSEEKKIFSPCAAAAMYLREAFLNVGGFDEDFFSYFEDVDLGFRLQLRGYTSMYVPDAVVHHIGSSTFGQRSNFAFYHSHRNMVWTFFKNMPSTLFWRYLLAHIMANFIYLLYYTLRGRGKVLWQAKWDALIGLPNALQKRRTIQNTRRIPDKNLIALMEHGWLQPYTLGFHLRRALKKYTAN